MSNPLLITLEILVTLAKMPTSTSELMTKFGISQAGVKRHIAEARLIGADIVSVKSTGVSRYELRNWPAISRRTEMWAQLERERDLREAPPQ